MQADNNQERAITCCPGGCPICAAIAAGVKSPEADDQGHNVTSKYATANGLRICYEEFGDPAQPAVLLIMGLSTQMIAWPEPFCEHLAAGGYRVIRFDNRDVGLSQKLADERVPNLLRLLLAAGFGLPLRVPYTLHDMARDTVGLLDGLGIERAHIVGASMGGMIAQLVAGDYPRRTLSLTSMMSTSGARSLPRASRQVQRLMMRRASSGEEEYLRYASRLWRLIGSPAYPPEEQELRERLLASYRRSYYPPGFLRQFAAIVASGDRVELLRRVQRPTLVIHGSADALVPVEGGTHTAELVPAARLALIDGMGHDLPKVLLPRLASLILEHIDNPEQRAA